MKCNFNSYNRQTYYFYFPILKVQFRWMFFFKRMEIEVISFIQLFRLYIKVFNVLEPIQLVFTHQSFKLDYWENLKVKKQSLFYDFS